jgi:hypothetical protein
MSNVYLAPAASCSTAKGRTARGRRRGGGGDGDGGGDGSRASAHSRTASSAPRDSAYCLSSSARTYMYVSARSSANIIANCRTDVL